MGKRIIAQRKGRGSMTYRTPAHRYIGAVKYPSEKSISGVVTDIMHDPSRSAPLAEITYENKVKKYALLPEGISLGGKITCDEKAEIRPGNILPLKNIPEGTLLFNIETSPFSGGKLVRSSGTYAVVISHDAGKTIVKLPSKKLRSFDPSCRATIGVVAGGDRKTKPVVKAGTRMHMMRARGKLYPITSKTAMNAVDHKFGGSNKGVAKTVSRTAPPGRKVGSIAAKKTGKKR